MRDMKPADTAAREAYEEAGIRGTVGRKALGTFLYDKDMDDGRTVPCEVKVFALKVARQLKAWPEQHEREARWLNPHEAVALIAEDGLRTMIDLFGSTHGRRKSVPQG
jgi:8-oxo-dGTP pyrophosphatase MutT (NUDIX family)